MDMPAKPAPRIPAKFDVASLFASPLMESRTIPLADRRLRVRLESMVWRGLDEAALREGRPIEVLCRQLDAERPSATSLKAAIRAYVLQYFKEAGSHALPKPARPWTR